MPVLKMHVPSILRMAGYNIGAPCLGLKGLLAPDAGTILTYKSSSLVTLAGYASQHITVVVLAMAKW